MDALYNALVNGQPEFKEDGTVITHPPTSLHLHAARAIKQLVETNNMNNNIVIQLQQQVNQYLQETQLLNDTINELRNSIPIPASNPEPEPSVIADSAGTSGSTESVHEDQGQASSV